MIALSNAKINVGLYVTGKREDGYHNIESIFVPIELKDAVEIIPAKQTSFHSYGNAIPGESSSNSCLKALQLMQKEHESNNYEISLLKQIPIGAGLGGGSSNASTVLQLINKKEELNLSNERLKELALQIGSDNAFFIENKTQFVSGRGEHLQECALNLSGYQIALIFPNIHLSTHEAYQNITIAPASVDLKTLTAKELFAQPERVTNAFQEVFINQFPESKKILTAYQEANALYASLSGSGSCFYGIFAPESEIPEQLRIFAQTNEYTYFESSCL